LDDNRVPSSFRDVGGFVYKEDGVVFRKIFKHSINDYYQLMDSGLYRFLTEKSALVKHVETPSNKDKKKILSV